MNIVKINKATLLAEVEKNRAKHEVEYKQAVTDCHMLLTELSVKHKTALFTDKISTVEEADAFFERTRDFQREVNGIPKPVSHVSDYDRIIRMLTLSADTEIVLESGDFDRYVQDDWEWKRSFEASSAFYTQELKKRG